MKNKKNLKILLTDDDDREFFADVIKDIYLNFPIEYSKNGQELLNRL